MGHSTGSLHGPAWSCMGHSTGSLHTAQPRTRLTHLQVLLTEGSCALCAQEQCQRSLQLLQGALLNERQAVASGP